MIPSSAPLARLPLGFGRCPLFPLLLLALSPTAPQPSLWRDIRAGMPVAEVMRKHPPEKGKITYRKDWASLKGSQKVGKCEPQVEVYYPNGLVDRVIVRSRPKGFLSETCGAEAEEALFAKYGKADAGGSAISRGLVSAHLSHRYVWNKDDVTITFKREYIDAEDSWEIRYEPVRLVPDIGL